jgi:hypothetical protein
MLVEVLKRGNNDSVSWYAAQNPNCPPKASFDWMRETGKISKFDPNKHVREFSDKVEEEDPDIKKLEDLLGNSKFNLKRYSQSWYTEEVARTTKDPKILTEILRRGKDDNVSDFAVKNPNCPPEILVEILRRGGKDDRVSCYAASNPNCPPKALVEILRRGKNDMVSCYAAQNPNCPPEMLVEVLKRGKNNSVSYYAAFNPNCPPKEQYLWMKAIGRLTKFDPNKHVREKVEEKEVEEDPDIKKIEDLLAAL